MRNQSNQSKILLSVIIPVYNVERYLERCVLSIVSQDKGDIEVILVNDGSKDNSKFICDELQLAYPTIIKVIHKENEGIASTRNTGIEAAKGEYVFFMDSDDSVHEHFLDYIRKRIYDNKYDKYKIIAFGYSKEKILNKFHTVCNETEIEYSSKQYIEKLLKNKVDNFVWDKIYKREIFNNIKFPKGRIYEDMATTFKLILAAENILYIDSQYYIYNYTNSNSITKSIKFKDLTDMFIAVNELCEGVKEFCEENGINSIYREYYKRNVYIYICLKLCNCGEEGEELKKNLDSYLMKNNKYNFIKFRHYNLKRCIYYYLMKKIRKY